MPSMLEPRTRGQLAAIAVFALTFVFPTSSNAFLVKRVMVNRGPAITISHIRPAHRPRRSATKTLLDGIPVSSVPVVFRAKAHAVFPDGRVVSRISVIQTYDPAAEESHYSILKSGELTTDLNTQGADEEVRTFALSAVEPGGTTLSITDPRDATLINESTIPVHQTLPVAACKQVSCCAACVCVSQARAIGVRGTNGRVSFRFNRVGRALFRTLRLSPLCVRISAPSR